MNRSTFLSRAITIVGLALLVGWVLMPAVQAPALMQGQSEPTPRPSPTPAVYIVVDPEQAVGQQEVYITVTGFLWPGGSGVNVYWEADDGQHPLAGPLAVDPSGYFQVSVTVPAEWCAPGMHYVLATNEQGFAASAGVSLLAPTPTDTPTPTFTPTPTPTDTPTPTPTPSRTPTPITPSPTPSRTPTPTRTPTLTPSPTLSELTPIATNTPIRPPVSQPTRTPALTLMPTHTAAPSDTPSPTFTLLPAEATTPTLTFTPLPVSTATNTPSPTPTATPSPTPSATPTALAIPTVPADTGTAGSPPAQVENLDAMGIVPPSGSSSSPGDGGGLPLSGVGWQATFLTGFIVAILLVVLLIAFLTVVLATGLFAWQYYHRKQAADSTSGSPVPFLSRIR